MKDIDKIQYKDYFTSKEMSNYIFGDKENNNSSKIYYYIMQLTNEGKIEKIGRNKYRLNEKKKKIFNCDYSNQLINIKDKITKQFPNLAFQIWENSFLNEFLNHQISENTIFIDVENGLYDFIYDYLTNEEQYLVLVKPSKEDYYRYQKNNIIVLDRLISESPKNKFCKNSPALEKLIIDVIASKYIDIDKSELISAITEINNKYQLNYSTLTRYAKRRNKYRKITELLQNFMDDNKE